MKLVINISEKDYKKGTVTAADIKKGQPLSKVIDKISEEINEKAFTEELFDEEVFNSTFTENVTKETAEDESVIETDIVKLSDILDILDKYKEGTVTSTEDKIKSRLEDCILNLLRSDDPKQYYGRLCELKGLAGLSFDEYEKLYEELKRKEYSRNRLCNTHVTASNSLGMGPW